MNSEIKVRPATPLDAEAMLDHVRRLSEEPDVDIPLAPGEFTITLEQERKLMAETAQSDNSVFLIAEIDGKLAGICNCKGGHRIATRHVARLGMSVERESRGRGVGTALMRAAIDWARRSGVITRIELNVYERNGVARRLYEKFGFQIEGRHRHAIFQRGQYFDDLTMALLP